MTPEPTQPDILSKSEFAARYSWSKSYVSKLAVEGRLILTDDGRVSVQASLARIAATTGAPERASQPVVSAGYSAARERREHYEAESARLDLEERVGSLLQAADAIAITTDIATLIRARLEALPDQLAPQLAALGGDENQIRNLLAQHHGIVLTNLAQYGQRMAALCKPPTEPAA